MQTVQILLRSIPAPRQYGSRADSVDLTVGLKKIPAENDCYPRCTIFRNLVIFFFSTKLS